ncbi:LysR family transcriptional regulator [Kribbella sandramycini]|uniref:DNA-binding transcriptional LysR family regulator n=1 Tax=Kribbella sandramycini TaxID=60450 RepID=A0A7Y4L6N5_9ACTN|nr:LysR family transcriptional regulator [Kribbella sandramycini]MBB6570093.1 DNA-binding transcriptional LysR family regulator [Kribbella sandramycini]NOL45405.1 LysR family transcriptional regulator [Kribbella sandramycini]
MDVEVRQLRCLVAVVETGTFTDAGIELGVSQAAVSRNVLGLEGRLGVRLLHRTSRSVTPTSAGVRVLARARQVLAEVDELVREATSGHTRLRVGHAWSALGRHTAEFQRRWAAEHPGVELQLVRTNTATGGLAEGLCDLAVVRAHLDLRRFAHITIAQEDRYAALPADDPLAGKRTVTLDQLRDRVLSIDRRTGSTTLDLWPEGLRPRVEYNQDVDDWLTAIASGRCVGVTAQATTTQYRRDGIVYRRLRDAPPVDVHLIWHRQDPHPATQSAVALLTSLYG